MAPKKTIKTTTPVVEKDMVDVEPVNTTNVIDDAEPVTPKRKAPKKSKKTVEPEPVVEEQTTTETVEETPTTPKAKKSTKKSKKTVEPEPEPVVEEQTTTVSEMVSD